MESEPVEKKGKYLIDTSALYPMLLEGITLDPNKFAISKLTEYEIGNVLWKENKQKKLKDPGRVAVLFADAIRGLERADIKSVADVLELAIDRDLTFYDASYCFIAETEHFRLITQDEKLRKKTKNAISVSEML
ncbi:MAG: type II toxin-antitoxin system VapC family toxin [Candidatus Micrarchaeaceae archaeon]